jgi:hypothetical protein
MEGVVETAAASLQGGDPFVASLQVGREAIDFSRHTLRKKFRAGCWGAAREPNNSPRTASFH